MERSEAVWSNCTRISMCEDMDTVCCPSFWKHFQKLKLLQDGTKVSVTLYEDKSQQERIEEYIMYQLKQAGCQGVSLGTLGNKIRNKFGNF